MKDDHYPLPYSDPSPSCNGGLVAGEKIFQHVRSYIDHRAPQKEKYRTPDSGNVISADTMSL